MSARVFNPTVLTELYKLRSPAVTRRHIPNVAAIAKIKRDLFGPVDREQAKRFIEKELAKHHEQSSQKWGFDFVSGQPASNKNQNFIWERVPPTIAPEMYTLSRAAHTRETTPISEDVTYENRLLDDKVNRQNNYKRLFDYNDVSMSTETTTSTSSTNLSSNKAILNIAMESSSKRQPKITDYLKERKRLAPTPSKKHSPPKKARNTYLLRQ